MLYVYRRESSRSARLLAEALNGQRIHHLDDRLQANDTIVAWGESVPSLASLRVLNGPTLKAKLTDARLLREAGVSTIEVSQTRPQDRLVPVEDPAASALTHIAELAERFQFSTTDLRSPDTRVSVHDLWSATQVYLTHLQEPAPAPRRVPAEDWIPRVSDHADGADLRTPPAEPDFWVRREATVREYRVHSFLGRSIRAGVKVRTDAAIPAGQEWIRAGEGWRISYTGVNQNLRDLAHAAVTALGLDFGAVDIGEREDGSLIVFEVNRAPLLEPGTVTAYANAVTRWMNGEWSTSNA